MQAGAGEVLDDDGRRRRARSSRRRPRARGDRPPAGRGAARRPLLSGSGGQATPGRPNSQPWPKSTSAARRTASSSGRSTPSATTRAPTSRANATVARRTAWRESSRSTPVTMPRQSLRKSGRISATYSSDVKPAPASSTAISAPRAIHGRRRSWMRRMSCTASCSVSSITRREGRRSASSARPGWPSASGATLTNSRRPCGGSPASVMAAQQATSRSSRRPVRAAAASVTSGGSATRPGGEGKRARPS